MQKVKVQRYISGKKPDYAQGVSSSEESDAEDFIEQQRPERRQQTLPQIITHKEEEHSDSEKEVWLIINIIIILNLKNRASRKLKVDLSCPSCQFLLWLC